MARTAQTGARGGRRKNLRGDARPGGATGSRAPRHTNAEYDAIQAAKQEAERREHLLEERRRVAAKWKPKIPEVRKIANFEAFKNHFHDLDEPDYAVEVLYASPNLQAQIRHEQTSRRKESLARSRAKWGSYSYGVGYAGDDYGYEAASAPRSKKLTGDDSKIKSDKKFNADASQLQDAYMQRIRIQSQPILGHITSLLNDTDKRSTSRTFMRPFKPLVYFQPKMKEILATLEEKWGDVESLEEVQSEASIVTPEEVLAPVVPAINTAEEGDDTSQHDNADDEDRESLQSVDSNAEEQELLMDGVEALRDMRCYVEFIENEVMPLYTHYDGTSAQKVRFEDLWALFRPGDLIHMPTNGDNSGRYHEIWKVCRVKSPEPDISYPKAGYAWLNDFRDEDKDDNDKKFTITAYYVDHDGTQFGAVRHKFFIDAYPGERSIESLDVFPLRFAENYEQLLASSRASGADFVKYLEPKEKHQAYNAWTLTRNPPFDEEDAELEVLRNENGEHWRHPEYIESDVIIDMSEAYQRNSDWRVDFYRPTITRSIECRIEDDEMPIHQWINGSRSNLGFGQLEVIQMSDGIEMRQRRENLLADAFLRQRARGSTHRQAQLPKTELREEDLVLLPKRMFAYVLRERRFVPIDISHLVPVRREQGVFENLRILKDYKDIVRGLVASHFEKKTIERKYVDRGTEGPSQDLIQGKGRGLVVLLHGVPGVGKTATAEAVAMENKKPLFVVTCGDLGLSPAEVERSLTNMFRLAHMWDCVLLLDEADVFLSQRSHADMKRNALVSVFLRVLEYYNGILFLTTNRVGSIDDAFKSRIHMSLYYPPLDKAQTREIFRLNVVKLREIEAQRQEMTGEPGLQVMEADIVDFASKHYEDNARSTGCWNGRQIRNAFQIASSLAHHKYSEEVALARNRGVRAPAAPVLDRTLFEKVQMSTQSFDRHMKDTKGVDASLPLRGTFHEEEKY